MKKKIWIIVSIIIIVITIVITAVLLSKNDNKKSNDKTSLEIKKEKVLKYYKENAAIEVFFEMGTSMETIEKIRDEISKIDGVTSTSIKTGKDALEEMQSKFPDEANIINGYGEETFPNSIIIKIENPENNQYVEEEIKKIESNVAENSIEEMSNGYYYFEKDIKYFDNLSEEEIDQFIEMMKIE